MKNDKGTIIYTGNFNLYNMNAAGKRVLANGKLLELCGYKIVYVTSELSLFRANTIIDTYTSIYDMDVYSYPSCINSRWNYIAYYKKLVEFIEEISEKNKIVAIITYGSPSLALLEKRLITFAHSKRIPIIADVVDWLKVDSGNLIFRMIKQLDINYRNAYVNKKMDGIIAISAYLRDYYSRYGINSIIIPPLEWERERHNMTNNEIVQIIYAGIPFRIGSKIRNPNLMKDRFDISLYYLSKAKKYGAQFKFHVYGFTKQQLLFSCPYLKQVISSLGDYVIFYGKKDIKDIKNHMQSMDYTIFIREKNRATTAGFPTKVSESISANIPVITTKTSDIEKYLPEGKGAFYIDISDEKSSVERLVYLFSLTSEEREKQKDSCLQIKCFEVDYYISTMKKYIDSICIET